MEFYQREDGSDSDYSLDYEYLGPRQPNYRNDEDADSDASDLSFQSNHDCFDMWDEDPYSTNDFTWQSNDMKLTGFIKRQKRSLDQINALAPWKSNSFWRKEKGWPKQLPHSMSTTNHDQSANSLSLVVSDYGTFEKLHTIYKNRILECGPQHSYIPPLDTSPIPNDTTWLDHDKNEHLYNSTYTSTKYKHTHASVSHRSSTSPTPVGNSSYPRTLISEFKPYAKYIKRSQFPISHPYLTLSFEPMCLAEKYGYIAIGGIEGEFELYCSMKGKPSKIWGTKFKGRNNVLLLTNAIQIIRFQHYQSFCYYLIACMNNAGILVYELPRHGFCLKPPALLHHLRAFDKMPINDARVSPDGRHLICVGDAAYLFHLTITFNHGTLVLGTPTKHTILPLPVYSSQYAAWSHSSRYFAHTSDSHDTVFVWRTQPLELIHRIPSAGYTYAIQFHPEREGLLVFSNRYGYIHTINLDEQYNQHVRHEITMVSFRGEKDKRLRILAKINGLQWSHNGQHLYVSTKKRVIAYEFLLQTVQPLEKIACRKFKSLLDNEEQGRRKRRKNWKEQWQNLPPHIQHQANTGLASHI